MAKTGGAPKSPAMNLAREQFADRCSVGLRRSCRCVRAPAAASAGEAQPWKLSPSAEPRLA